jgi:DNA polymerase sigma
MPRVYVPDKRNVIIEEVLKDLYLLKQAIDHQTGTHVARSATVDKIREKLKTSITE